MSVCSINSKNFTMKKQTGTARAREQAFRAAVKSLRQTKLLHRHARQHRAISRLPIGPYLLLQAIALPTLFCGGLVWAKPYILRIWRDCVVFWAQRLNIPLQVDRGTGNWRSLDLIWAQSAPTADLPSNAIMLATAAATALAFLATVWMNGRLLPLKYLIRILCVVQAMALLFFWLWPTQFPYTPLSHLTAVIDMGYELLLAIPVMLAIGYYILNVRIAVKAFYTTMILAYFFVMIPNQAVLHMLILQHLSVLFMPVLYICFGAVFDVLIFVALYSWVASMAPAQATI